MKKTLGLILIVSFMSILRIHATEAECDIISYKDSTMHVFGWPLESHPTIHINSNSLFNKSGINTSNWKGYVASSSIIDGHLYLISVQNVYKTERADLVKIFGNNCINGKVFADWFSGSLYCLLGKRLVTFNDITSYEKELELVIRDGVLIRDTLLDNTKSRNYDKFMGVNSVLNNDRYQSYIDSLINWKELPPINGDSVRSIIQFSANEEGVLDQIAVFRSGGFIFDSEAIRIIKEMPVSIRFFHGKLLRTNYVFPILFKESTRIKKTSNR